MLCRDSLVPEQSKNNNSIGANYAKSKCQNSEGLYDFPSDEDDDVNAYSKIHTQQFESFGAQSSDYDMLFSESEKASKAPMSDYQTQNVDNVEYNQLDHFRKKEEHNENYQRLLVNSAVTFSTVQLDKKFAKTKNAPPTIFLQNNDSSADIAIYSEINK